MLYLAADHAGFELKKQLKNWLDKQKIKFQDLGPLSEVAVDYPDYAHKLASLVVQKRAQGILICGTGLGMSIAANRWRGIRAARCGSELDAKLAREHNNANVLTLGARQISVAKAQKILQKFLTTKFAGGRHQRRVRKIESLSIARAKNSSSNNSSANNK